MVDRTEALVLQMSADIRKMERALNQARGQTNRQLSAVEKRFDQMNASVRRSGDEMARDLRASIASIGIGLAIREVTGYADVWTTARNQLAAAGVAQDQLAGTMAELVNLARSTRSEFGGTVELYAKLTRAGQQLNLTQAEVAKITETTLQAFVAGGAAASEQASAVTQLSQALGSGVLQGDELRSIRENAPLLAEAIAKEFNTTIAGLKELGAEGELTADRVARAILNADGIFESFERTVSTVEQAMTNLRTEFTRYIAESRIAQTAIQALSGFIQLVTDNIDLFADAAIVAAAVIGGTLAVAAIGRLVAGLGTVITTVRTAQTAMVGLRAAMTFLGGPIGATILGIGAALAAMALGALDSSSAAERAADSLEKLGKIRDDITSQTSALQSAQEKLNDAIKNGGEAARIAGALEVDRIRRLLDANRALFQIERARAQQALNDRSSEFRTKPVEIRNPDGSRRLNDSLENLDFKFLTPSLRARGQSVEEFATDIGNAARLRNLTDQERILLEIAQAVLAYRQEMRALTDQVKEFDKVLAETAPGGSASGQALAFPDLPSQSGGGGSGARGFRTDIEQATDALEALGEEAARDAKLIADAVASVQSLLTTDQTAEGFTQKWREANAQLGSLYEDNAQRALDRSRAAVQALLDLAQNDIPAAFEAIPSFGSILTGDDEALLREQLTQLAMTAADAVAVGADAIAVEFASKFKEIEQAQMAAIAAGIFDESVFEKAYSDLFDWLDAQLSERTEVPFPYDMEALHEEMMAAVDDIEWEVAGEELRQVMRDSIKNALREGIRTGDWGDAFAMILADAVTAGLDDALNRIGDWLADALFAENGFLSNLASAAGSWLSSAAFPRAGGGAAMAGRGYRINDRGDGGEFLFMGSNPGQVLRNSDLAGMLGGSRGQSVSINAPLNIMGSVDAVTWPKVQEAMRQQARQIMTAVPATVNATLIDNRIQKRRL